MGHGIILAAQAYGAIGALVALWFLMGRIEREDAGARGAYGFRPLLVPGIVMLWPLVVWRVMVPVGEVATFRREHMVAWRWLAVLLPLVLMGAMAIRQNGPLEAPPVRLSAP